jgi:HlyD family secretion protein
MGVSFEGRLTPRQSVALSLPAGGRATRVLANEGERVEASDVLVQLDSYPQAQAEVAKAELELTLARQALNDLYEIANVALAQAGVVLAQASKAQALAEDLVASLERSKSPAQISQAYANLLLAEKRRDSAQSDLAKAKKRFANKKSIIWYFVSRKKFALGITKLEGAVAYYERRYQDAKDKYEDLLKPVDAIDLSVAQGNLAMANANLALAQRKRLKLLDGPDPDELAVAQARLRLAESSLAAAQASLRSAEIVSPISGVLVSLSVKPGEWIPAGQPVATIADLDEWVVESKDLKETSIPYVQPGQAAYVTIKAYPQVELAGRVESISQLYIEDDGDIFYQVKVELREPAEILRWGMSAEVALDSP